MSLNSLNRSGFLEFQSSHHLNSLSLASLGAFTGDAPPTWIVSSDFTEWLSKSPEEIYGHHANGHVIIPQPTSKTEPVQPQKFCRPQDIIPSASEPEVSFPPRLSSSFPPESLQDFKHVLYNLLVEHHNNPNGSTFVQSCEIEENGVLRQGFRFNSQQNPEKKLPELYAQHIRKARLDCEDQNSVFIQDLYKYYMRACVELLSKYFEKRDKYTYLYDGLPLFVPGETLEQAEDRIRTMKTRARKKRKIATK